ncbi:MAG: DUF5915 domain-containing protein, partial [Bacteroidales bacterium]
WGGDYGQDKIAAYQTLYTCLETVAKLMSPIAPFYADKLYCDLVSVSNKGEASSIHLADFPTFDNSLIDKVLEVRMQLAQDISSMVLALRKKVNIKVRQPLSAIMLPVMENSVRANIDAIKPLILSEVNVKELNFVENTAGILVKRIKPDFKKLGPKYGKIMKQLAVVIAEMDQAAIQQFENDGKYTLTVDGQPAEIEVVDVDIISEDIPGWLVANEGRLTVALDITITEELKKEGLARELVNRIQNIRKSSGFEITDKISIKLTRHPEIDEAIADYSEYIANQVLANEIVMTDKVDDGIEMNFEEFILYVSVTKS